MRNVVLPESSYGNCDMDNTQDHGQSQMPGEDAELQELGDVLVKKCETSDGG